MVESLTIRGFQAGVFRPGFSGRGFQGIREGVIEDFSPLTVITGVNGCGKSTVLDALLVTHSRKPFIPGFEALEILAEHGGQSSLYITKQGEGAIPLSVSGDGIQALVQMAVSLATISDGLALIEEPEVFQHPGSLRQTARVLWANVRRGVQVVLTTHSLDFIDALVETATEEDMPKLAVLTLALDDGMLRCSRVAGDDVRYPLLNRCRCPAQIAPEPMG